MSAVRIDIESHNTDFILPRRTHAAGTLYPESINDLGEWAVMSLDPSHAPYISAESVNNLPPGAAAIYSCQFKCSNTISNNPKIMLFLGNGLFEVTSESSSTPNRMEIVITSISRLSEKDKIGEALETCFRFIEASFAKLDIDSVNKLLTQSNAEQLPLRVSIGMLRATLRANKKLAGWQPLLERVRSRVIREGLNENRALRGLTPG